MCELRHGPYYYAYWKDPESKKLKKRYAGDYMPKNKESNDSAISDPKLLADRLPDTRQQEIFDYAKIKEFVSTMLRQPVWLDSNHDKFDARRTRLAAIMAEESLKKCIDQYKNKIEKSEVLSKQNVSLLENAISLCNEISIRVQWLETESKTKE
jgi:hypothetical protein